jgi:gas vesicle protein
MTERHAFTGGHLLLAIAGGALVGGAAVLWLAPKTRRELRSQLEDLAARSKEKATRVPKPFTDATDAAREAFVGTLDRG